MSTKKNYYGPLAIIGILFFAFGFITWVNATLISFFRNAFDLSNTQAYLVTFAFYISYTVMAIPSSKVLEKVGFKRGMSLGLFIMAIGTLLFIPAAEAESYPVFLVGLFVIGIGLTLLQTAANPYVTILGPIESAAQRISILGIANKTAGIISQKIFGGILLAGSTAITLTTGEHLQKVVGPYKILTGILVLLAIWVWFMKGLPEVEEEEEVIEEGATAKSSIFQYPNLVLGLLTMFCYVGLEVIAGDTIISYGEHLGFAKDLAKDFGTYTLWLMLLGYIMGIFLIPKVVSQQNWLKYSSIFGIIVSIVAIYSTGFTSVMSIAILGLANAIMWPAIWPLALNGLGKHTKLASALLIMMIAGGAVLPMIYGKIADLSNAQSAYWVLVPLYLVVLYYAISGHKKKSW